MVGSLIGWLAPDGWGMGFRLFCDALCASQKRLVNRRSRFRTFNPMSLSGKARLEHRSKWLANANYSYYHHFINARSGTMVSSRLQPSQEPSPGTGLAPASTPVGDGMSGFEIDSAALLGSAGRVFICHGGERYLLRRTRHGKLILTK